MFSLNTHESPFLHVSPAPRSSALRTFQKQTPDLGAEISALRSQVSVVCFCNYAVWRSVMNLSGFTFSEKPSWEKCYATSGEFTHGPTSTPWEQKENIVKKKKKKVKVVFLSSARTNSASAGSVLINPPVSERKTPPQKDWFNLKVREILRIGPR